MLRAAEIAPKTARATSRKLAVATSMILALVCGFALRSYWTFLIPYNDAPDEFCHFPMVQYLARHGRPPTMDNVPREIPVSYPALCPLGYVPLAIPVALAGAEDLDALRIARLTNAAIGVMMVFLVFLAMRQLAPAWPEVAATAAWIAALHPQLVFISSYVNNDATMLLVVAALWMAWIQLGRMGPGCFTCPPLLLSPSLHQDLGPRQANFTWLTLPKTPIRAWCNIGVLSALAILCKPNACGVALAGLPIFVVQFHTAWRSREVIRCLLPPIAGLTTAFLVLAPWCLWNWSQHRSLFGLEIHRDWWDAHTAEAGVRQGYLTVENAGDFVSGTWSSFWGCFGYATTHLPEINYLILTLTCGLAAGALLSRKSDRRVMDGWASRGFLVAVWVALLLGAILVWSSHAWHSASHGMAAQGRYVLPMAVPCLAVLAMGVSLFAKRGREWIPAGLLVAMFALLQVSAVSAEQQSNRLPQPDRRVRARLLALVSDLPGSRLAPMHLPVEFVGEGTVVKNPHAASIHSKGNACIRWRFPIAARDLGGVEIEQRWLGGLPADGELRIRAADGQQEVLAIVPYRDALLGAASYRFDLRRISSSFIDRHILIEILPSTEPCRVEWYRFDVLGRDLETLNGK